MNKTNATAVLKVLEEIFGRFGYAREMVSDNGPPFFSHEFKSKIEALGTKLTNSPPYNPQSNGIVERAVQTTKTVLKKIINENKNNLQVAEALKEFLFNYRNSPCTEKGFTPAEKIFSFHPRTELTKLKQDRENRESNLQVEKNKKKFELKPEINVTEHKKSISGVREFKDNENVLYVSKTPGQVVGLKATIVKRKSELTYWIKINDALRLAHVNQLRKSALKSPLINYAKTKSFLPISQDLGTPTEKTATKKKKKTPPKASRPRRDVKPPRRFTCT
jgi:hypothetical protein